MNRREQFPGAGSGRQLVHVIVALAGLLPLATTARADALPVWELNGTQNRILIMGSIHFLRAEDQPLADGLIDAYEAADALYMEIDMDDLNPFSAQLIMTELGTDPDGRTLRELLGTSTYSEASRKAQALGVDLAMVDNSEPWFAALLITQLRLMMLGFDPGFGVEQQFLERARADGKIIHGLETMQEQLAALDKLPLSAQRKFLIQTLDEAAEVESEMDTVVAAWKIGDTRTLERVLLAGLADNPSVYQSLLVQRNRNWARKIRALADDSENYLIIVGAMHLVGDDSMLRMLAASGHPARQLSSR
jgi:uncharacterized protein YbaP (TraB family)